MDDLSTEIRHDLKMLKLVGPDFEAPAATVQPKIPPVVWAVDAFPDDLELQIRTATALQATFPTAAIHPVYVLNEEAFIDRGYSTYLRPALKPMAFKAALRILSETNLNHAKKPRILNASSTSRISAARRLLRYARKIGATTIAVGSHARTGLTRFLSGNFADELISAGELPILIAGPVSTEPHIRTNTFATSAKEVEQRAIVFPTDFSPACEAAFEMILSMAAEMKADLHILHRETYTVDPYAQIGMSTMGGGWVSMDSLPTTDFDERTRENHQTDFEKWRKLAEERGVMIRLIAQNLGEPVAQGILNYVGTLLDTSVLLAMVSQATPVTASFLGNVTQEVIRLSPCPVYVAPRFKSTGP